MTGDIVDLDISGFNANATITVRGNNNSAVLVYATKSALEEERFRFMVGGDDAPLEWRLVPVQSHAGRHHTGGLDPITPANISAMPAYEFRNFNLSAGQSVSLLQGRNVVVNASMSNDGNSTLTLPRMAFASTDNAIANDEIIINATNVSSVRTITVIQFNYDGGSGYLNTTTPLTIISNNGSIRLRLSAGNGYVWEIVPVDRHTQPVNTLTQSDALQGQVVTWNGTQWAPSTVIAAVSRISFGPMQLARARNTLFADSGYNPGATNNRRNNFYRQTPRGNTALGNGDTAAFPFPFNPSVFLGPGGTYSITAYVRVTGAYNDGVHCQIRRNILGFDLNGALRECWLEDVSGSKIPVDSAGSPSGALSDFGGGTGAADRVYFATQSGLAITNEWIQFVPYFSAYTPNNGATIQDVELVIYRDL
jgi:hypothetical protein